MVSTDKTAQVTSNVSEKLWTKNFFLLWQGQFISAIGDAAYSLALGFWVLAVTGSTALMGTLMAFSTLPRILISPFAGVLVDRWDRKKLLIWMDIIRGICIILVGYAALKGFAQVWMVFVAGIIMGICAAFFNPTVNSVLPDIVPGGKLVQANSVYGMIFTGSNILGNSVGGFLYQWLGAPLMFLLNGFSYVFAGTSEVLLKVPKVERKGVQRDFWQDFRAGFKFIWEFKGLRYLVTVAVFSNFFAGIAMVLFLPFFQSTEGLGPEKYGLAMTMMMAGALGGMLLMSTIQVPPQKRMSLFVIMGFLFAVAFIVFPFIPNYIGILGVLFIGGFANSIVNVFINSSMQLTVPPDMRGKVFAMFGTLLQGLTPIAMALGGIIAEFVPVKYVIAGSMTGAVLVILPVIVAKAFVRFIAFDPATQTVEEIM